ncbi:MAG: ABC transporter permease [Lachnospiraceae bacterium]|nr:ABC transporter permease [Lachnospiraceae bacterium]
MNKFKVNTKSLLAGPYLVWMIGFTVIPLLMIGWYGLTDREGSFTLANIAAIADADHLEALGLSLLLSLACTIVCLLIAYPLAMILKASGMGKGAFVVFIFILPMWMNSLLRTYAWLNLLDDGGILNQILSALGLPSFSVVGTNLAVVSGMVYNYLPFMVLPLYNVLVKIDENVINAARDLGANSFQVFYKVVLPLSFPGIVSGVTMVFVPSLTTFAVSDLLGARKILLIGNIIEQEFSTASNWNLGSGLSLVLMVFILISMALLDRYDKNGEGTSF